MRAKLKRASVILPFPFIPFSIFFLKFFASAGTLISRLGFISFMQMGMLRRVSIGVLPTFTDAMLAPLPMKAYMPAVWANE
ncbi:MAG: hypothetical protein BWY89_01320 [Bacteroidetes bacterium ADurb.BinA012]|nr:MAG: hypothetical protein BWY89_01320 [Bacteroidetes bacterium ADurb.BinA012]